MRFRKRAYNDTAVASAATMPITILVVVDELCTIVVARIPMNRPINGEKVASRIFCENSMPPMPTMNR